MKLSKNNQKIVDILREKQLTHLIKPFVRMVELDKLGKIKVHKMTWKVIMRDFHDKHATRADLENVIVSYLAHFGIILMRQDKVDPKVSKERVKKFRSIKKALGYKNVSFLVSELDLERLKQYKEAQGMTYQEVLSFMISKLPKKV